LQQQKEALRPTEEEPSTQFSVTFEEDTGTKQGDRALTLQQAAFFALDILRDNFQLKQQLIAMLEVGMQGIIKATRLLYRFDP
jgi:hypothetical protein